MAISLSKIFPAGDAYANATADKIIDVVRERTARGYPANDNKIPASRVVIRPHALANASVPFKLEMYRDIEPNIRKDWVVVDFLGRAEFSAWYGAPGVGKSVLVGDLACHVAAGWNWFGHTVQGGPVLYIAAERAMVVKRRFAAFRKEHKGRASDLPVGIVSGYIDLCSGASHTNALIDMIGEFEKNIGAAPVLVVVDTVARTLGGGDENGSKEMGSFVSSTGKIQAATNAHILVIHHPPIQGQPRLRGHSSLLGALDTTVLVKKNTHDRTAIVEKQNDGEEGIKVHFDLKSVTLFVDQDGATTAPIVVPLSGNLAGMAQGAEERRAPRGKSAIVLKSLHAAVGESGQIPPLGTPGIPEGVRAVDREAWRKRYYNDVFADRIGDKDTARKAFDRAVKSLLASKHIGQLAERFWVTPEPGHNGTCQDIQRNVFGQKQDITGQGSLDPSRLS